MCAVQAFLPQAKILADCARRRVSERNRRLRRHLARRWAIHLPRAFESPEGEGGLWPPEPRKGSRQRPGPRTAGRRICAVQAFLPQAKILADCARRRVSERNRRVAAALSAEMAEFTAQPLAALPPYGCGVPLAGISAEHFDHRRTERAGGPRSPQKRTSKGCPRSQNQPRTQRSGSRLEAKKKHVRRMKRP